MKIVEQELNGRGMRIGIVQSRFNDTICDGLLMACLKELRRLGVSDADIMLAKVPGALEIPLVLSKMALGKRFDGLVAVGAIIRGETYHFEVVSNESARGVSMVQLETGVPVANVILTTENDEQALARVQVKGTEAAQVVIEMINLTRCLSIPDPLRRKEMPCETLSDFLALNALG